MKSLPQPIPILIVLDAEPDDFFIDPGAPNAMQGLQQAFATMRELREHLQAQMGRPPHFVWLVRADRQIADAYGEAAHLFREFRDQFAEAMAAGDDVGIHFHAYRLQEDGKTWVEDYGDQEWVEVCLHAADDAFRATFGRGAQSASAGHSWLSHRTVALEERLGIRHELSVVSGRAPKPFPSHLGQYTGALPDFRDVPPAPYHPSAADYREADPAREGALWIIPHKAGVVAKPAPTSLRGALAHMARSVGLASRPAPNKLFLRQGPEQIAAVVEAILAASDHPYLTFTSRTAPFANPAARASILRTFDYLAGHALADRFHFARPDELLAIHGNLVEPPTTA
ncbi:MAG: hypothetical protein ACRC1H_05085 [Caldilineaceae bacterium]